MRASSPSLQSSRCSITSFPKAPSSLREVICSDAGGGPSFKIALLAFVGGLRLLRLWLLLLLKFSSPPFALIVAVFGHVCGYLTDIYNNQPLEFYGSLEQELYNPQAYFAAEDQMVLLSFWFAHYYDHNVLATWTGDELIELTGGLEMNWLNWLVILVGFKKLRVRGEAERLFLEHYIKTFQENK